MPGAERRRRRRRYYAQLCANCHGSNLEGTVGPPFGPELVRRGETRRLLHGHDYQGQGTDAVFPALSEEQLDRLIAYIRQRQAAG